MYTRVKTASEIKALRHSGQILGKVLQLLEKQAEDGMTTKDLARIAADELRRLGGEPAFLGYQGFPDVLCVSVNDEVVHGIPSDERVLADGDVVSMDFGVQYEGMITDAARTVIIGRASKGDRRLVETTRESLNRAIKVLKAGVQVGDIGAAAQQPLEQNKFGIVRDFVGHGVGHFLHEDPNIPNYGTKGTGMVLEAGMTIAIEPMATLGEEAVYIASDQWTVKTLDQSRAAHFEDTILITDAGYEILTRL